MSILQRIQQHMGGVVVVGAGEDCLNTAIVAAMAKHPNDIIVVDSAPKRVGIISYKSDYSPFDRDPIPYVARPELPQIGEYEPSNNAIKRDKKNHKHVYLDRGDGLPWTCKCGRKTTD